MATTKPASKKWDLKRIGATVALAGTLFGGLSVATGWYSARIQADVQADVQKVEISTRLDKVEDSIEKQERKLQLSNVRSIRTEQMIETLLEERHLPVPDKTPTQVRIEKELDELEE